MFGRRIAGVVILLIASLSANLLAQGRRDVLFETGGFAPGSGVFSALSTPINQGGGRVMVNALVNDTPGRTFGIFTSLFEVDSAFNLDFDQFEVIRSGDAAPDGNGTFDSTGNGFALDFFGTPYFTSSLSGTTGAFTDRGIFAADFTGSGYSPRAWARGGQSSPIGGTEIYTDFRNALQSSFGSPLFIADVDGGSNGPSSIIVDAFTEVARLGGTVNGTNGSWTSFDQLTAGGNFVASLSGGGNGVFMRGGSGYSLVSQSGSNSIDGDGVVSSITSVSGQQGRVAFLANLDSNTTSQGAANDQAIYVADSSGQAIVAREGQVVNGIGTFASVNSRPLINTSGDVVFHTTLASGQGAIVSWNDGVYTELSSRLLGDQNGTTISATGRLAVDSSQSTPRIAYEGQLSNGETGLFFTDGTEQRVVAVTGQNFLGSSIQSIAFRETGQSNHDAIGEFTGEVAYVVSLADGREVVTNWVPELRWRANGGGSFSNPNNFSFGINPGRLHDVVLYHFESPLTPIEISLGQFSIAQFNNMSIGGVTGQVDGQVRLNLNGGTLRGNRVFVASTGVIEGNGVIDARVTEFLGTTGPGNSIGRLDFSGDLLLGETSLLEIELGLGDSLDFLNIDGDFLIDGLLNVSLIDGRTELFDGEVFYFAEVGGDVFGQFDLLSQNSIVGRFGEMDLRIDYNAMNQGRRFVALYSSPSAIPEPTAFVVLVVTASSLFMPRRRRREL